MKNAWTVATANRQIVLKTAARTNVLKKDVDEWLGRVEEGLRESEGPSMLEPGQEPLENSELIGKYNEILREYGHRL